MMYKPCDAQRINCGRLSQWQPVRYWVTYRLY